MGLGYQNSVGRLYHYVPGRASGKKSAEWRYVFADPDGGISDEPIRVQVSLHHNQDGAFLTASCHLFEEDLQETDINALHALVFEKLEAQARLLTGIEWQDWLEIVVAGETVANLDGRIHYKAALAGDLEIEVNCIKYGRHPETGVPLTINHNGAAVPFPTPTRLQDPQESGEGSRLAPQKERAYVPATPENIQALRAIIERMEALRSGLSDLLSHQNVGASPDIGGDTLDLLPAPGG